MKDFIVKIVRITIFFGLMSLQLVQATNQPNVLFIAVDDLRPDLGSYGNKVVQSPNIDKLAGQSLLFQRHYVTVPTCGASRHSLLTGLYPTDKEGLSNQASVLKLAKSSEKSNPETFIHRFKQAGYNTIGIGKISHHPDGRVYGYTDAVSSQLELPLSWDEMLFDTGVWKTGHNAFFGYADGTDRNHEANQVFPYEAGDVDDEGYVDGLTAQLAIKKLQGLAQQSTPFFLGVGFIKPHLPFVAPKKYWDLYQRKDIPLSPVPDVPKNIELTSLHNSDEFNQYEKTDENPSLENKLSDKYAKKLIHGYYASISYVDAQIGKVLDQLHSLGLADNTIVVLWGDHGWHLGDYGIWGKHTLFEKSLHSPLLIKIPNQQAKVIEQVVSTVDIYPTLLALANVKQLSTTDGQNLANIAKPQSKKVIQPAYSFYNDSISMRTNRYRITKHNMQDKHAIELYDHLLDKNETRNVASEQPKVVNTLMQDLLKRNMAIYQK